MGSGRVKYLLDTSVWYRGLVEPATLPNELQAMLANRRTPFALSDISLWEIGKKVQIGKMTLKKELGTWLEEACTKNITVLPMTSGIVNDAMHLPRFPVKDPADEIIVATARVHDLILLTLDRKLRNYRHAKIEYYRPRNLKPGTAN
jgi:PIN domain nuclease of toxin-antitoxin system